MEMGGIELHPRVVPDTDNLLAYRQHVRWSVIPPVRCTISVGLCDPIVLLDGSGRLKVISGVDEGRHATCRHCLQSLHCSGWRVGHELEHVRVGRFRGQYFIEHGKLILPIFPCYP